MFSWVMKKENKWQSQDIFFPDPPKIFLHQIKNLKKIIIKKKNLRGGSKDAH